MRTKAGLALVLALALLAAAAVVAVVAVSGKAPAQGGAPAVVSYQGEVRLDGAPYAGTGYFKFAVVNAAGDTTYWSNDGTPAGEPAGAVPLTVTHGLFSVLLGDTALDNMTQALTAEVFAQPDRYLRVWFSTDSGGPFSPLSPDTRIAAVPFALQAQQAADADTVDGLHAADLQTHYQNVVVVAKSGGDYTGVQAAINSIADATAGNPYLIWVAPGVYVEQVTMKPHVHLQGAGQGATIISSTASSDSPTTATLALASETSLRDLTVANDGAGPYNIALMATAGTTRTLVADVTARARGGGTNCYGILVSDSGTGVTLEQVSALAENGVSNAGLCNANGAATVIDGGSYTGRGGTQARGIQNRGIDTTLEATGVTALGEGGSAYNNGLENEYGVATLRGGSYTGRGGTQAWGIRNRYGGATLEAEEITALAENGSTYNWGLDNTQGAQATLDSSSVMARIESGGFENYGLHNFDGATATLRGGTCTALGSLRSEGIRNSSATLEVEGVTVVGKDASDNYGLYNDSATATADGSRFTGDPGQALYQGSGTVYLAVSQLDGGASRPWGILTCFQVYDGGYAAYTCP